MSRIQTKPLAFYDSRAHLTSSYLDEDPDIDVIQPDPEPLDPEESKFRESSIPTFLPSTRRRLRAR